MYNSITNFKSFGSVVEQFVKSDYRDSSKMVFFTYRERIMKTNVHLETFIQISDDVNANQELVLPYLDIQTINLANIFRKLHGYRNTCLVAFGKGHVK